MTNFSDMETLIEGIPVTVPHDFLRLFYELTKRANLNGRELTRAEYQAWLESYKQRKN